LPGKQFRVKSRSKYGRGLRGIWPAQNIKQRSGVEGLCAGPLRGGEPLLRIADEGSKLRCVTYLSLRRRRVLSPAQHREDRECRRYAHSKDEETQDKQ